LGAIVMGSVVVERNPTTCPGRSATRSGALQNRDLRKLCACNDPGSAVHRFTLHRVRETLAVSI
jgi:hypothetical protein